ncbi:hypothetical protein [Tumebacillus flagellatus]|uniref:hypothetical protein n=1 Tax=Tumebacillus flagellatus TaxID=1157490 RepID=UPI001376FAF2|nr:hypothetical protein [Tumebacillus flagellatus]
MNVANVGQAVNLWVLQQALAADKIQALQSVSLQIVNNLNVSLDPNLGQSLDLSV